MRFPCLNRGTSVFVSLAFLLLHAERTDCSAVHHIFIITRRTYTYLQYTLQSECENPHFPSVGLCYTTLYASYSGGILSVNNFCPCHFYCRKTHCSIILQRTDLCPLTLAFATECVLITKIVRQSKPFCFANKLLSAPDFNYILAFDPIISLTHRPLRFFVYQF
jgi:hypothetical protein